MAAYYNEIDPYAAEWLRNLIKAGHITDGEVDTRSIVDVSPNDIKHFDQCHFFAGVAGWSHALRLAKWADDRKIWTGSCPCQPFSVAGKGKGTDDERHLWPHFFRLIRGCRPPVVMGEQVAGAAGYGWLDGVRSDLESEDYSIEGVDISACATNAPHIRNRIYWVSMADAKSDRHQKREWQDRQQNTRSQRQSGLDTGGNNQSFWHDAIWINGADGKARRAEPSIRLLANGVPARVGKLRAYGNAIVPPLAAEVVKAFMEDLT
jgi:DNA (cytosine-5)-methyltransferase 1